MWIKCDLRLILIWILIICSLNKTWHVEVFGVTRRPFLVQRTNKGTLIHFLINVQMDFGKSFLMGGNACPTSHKNMCPFFKIFFYYSADAWTRVALSPLTSISSQLLEFASINASNWPTLVWHTWPPLSKCSPRAHYQVEVGWKSLAWLSETYRFVFVV